MPLAHGKSEAVFKKNVSEMIRAGHPRDQALAAAYREKRGFAYGGATDFDIDTDALVTPTVAQLTPMMQRFMPPEQRPNPSSAHPTPQRKPPEPGSADSEVPYGGWKNGGTAKKLAQGGASTSATLAPWYARAEERQTLHPEGLINSPGAGRTDVHNINVPSGSYIIPSDIVSGLAEGNTLGGAGIIDRMMHSNPYGVQSSSGHRGSGPPRAPHALKATSISAESRGGKTQEHTAGGVPIVIAGGEYLIHPGTVIKKFGSLKQGHAHLDAFVRQVRKETAKTLSKLPGPKK